MSELKFRYRIRQLGGIVITLCLTIEDIENHKGLSKIALKAAGMEILSRDRYVGKINGEEIYEGDYLEGSESGEFGSTLSTWTYVVVCNEETAAFVFMDIGVGETLGLDDVMSDKVSGNIYDHPEWLERIKEEFDALRGGKK